VSRRHSAIEGGTRIREGINELGVAAGKVFERANGRDQIDTVGKF